MEKIKKASAVLISCFLISFSLIFFNFISGANLHAAPMDMVIVLDRSGSMITTDKKGLSVPAAAFILEQLSLMGENNRAAVVPFKNTAMVLGQKTINPGSALTKNIPGLVEMLRAGTTPGTFNFTENVPENPIKFSRLLRSQMKEEGGTELDMALTLSGKILRKSPHRRKVIILISDGEPHVNYKSTKRLEQLGQFINMNLIRKLKKRNPWRADIRNINKQYAAHILKTTVPDLVDNNISIIPIAFAGDEGESQALIEYLKQIRELSEGDDAVTEATSHTLIQKLMGILPCNENHIQLYRKINFIENNSSLVRKNFEIDVPKFSKQIRFFFSFPDSTPQYRVEIKLYHKNVIVADLDHIHDFEVIHTGQFLKNGSSVYQSFRFKNTDVSGKWRIELSVRSESLADHLPETDFLVDVRAGLHLGIDVLPQENALQSREPVEFQFTLSGDGSKGTYAIPIKKIDAFLIGRKPDSINGFSDKIRNIKYGKTSVAKWDQFEHPGLYMLKGWAYFSPVSFPELRLKVYFQKRYKILPAAPVEAWFSLRGSREKIPGNKLELPVLGERISFDFRNLLIQTSSRGNVTGLSLKLEPLMHEKSGTKVPWLSLKSNRIRRLSSSNPAMVTLNVKLSEIIEPDLPDGMYKSELILQNGITELDSIEIFVPVKIPRLVKYRKNIDKLFAEKADNPVITSENTIYYPGDYSHYFHIPLWSTSSTAAEVFPFFPFSQGMKLSDQNNDYQGNPRNDKIIFSCGEKSFLIPEKNTKKPGIITAEVVLKDNFLNGSSYMNILQLKAKGHREKIVKLITHVRFVPLIYLISAGAAFLLLSIFMFFEFKKWFNNRKLFTNCERCQDDNEINYYTLFGKETLGKFIIKDVNHHDNILSFRSGNWDYYIVPGGKDPDDPSHWQQKKINFVFNVKKNDVLIIKKGKKEFRFLIEEVPTRFQSEDYSYYVDKSIFGYGRYMKIYFLAGLIFVFAACFFFVSPYAVLRLAGL